MKSRLDTGFYLWYEKICTKIVFVIYKIGAVIDDFSKNFNYPYLVLHYLITKHANIICFLCLLLLGINSRVL